jgi:hypothetical protein
VEGVGRRLKEPRRQLELGGKVGISKMEMQFGDHCFLTERARHLICIRPINIVDSSARGRRNKSSVFGLCSMENAIE